MPRLGAEILDGLKQFALLVPFAVCKVTALATLTVNVKRCERISQHLIVGSHGLVVPTIGFAAEEESIHHSHRPRAETGM